MIRDFKAPRSAVLLSSARYALLLMGRAVPDVIAGIALVLLLVLLPIMAALML